MLTLLLESAIFTVRSGGGETIHVHPGVVERHIERVGGSGGDRKYSHVRGDGRVEIADQAFEQWRELAGVHEAEQHQQYVSDIPGKLWRVGRGMMYLCCIPGKLWRRVGKDVSVFSLGHLGAKAERSPRPGDLCGLGLLGDEPFGRLCKVLVHHVLQDDELHRAREG